MAFGFSFGGLIFLLALLIITAFRVLRAMLPLQPLGRESHRPGSTPATRPARAARLCGRDAKAGGDAAVSG